ncbi:MAG: nicotinate-nucleotide adenylyltransferase [Owenweeksia sp.]|nr:nicotinate-nucleotide adenylyltransferase [Owenweeksia sp.]MBG00387.1 nicotinate-nucleotide adenylyltransferase [Owenweeksia sp.]|tara:strand:+ start:1727 stop:3202 length:1476 start_codon:yes stop_codon:yes gene_type:complete
MERIVLTTTQKALKINLNENIYGTFAEIGAGQEVVRHFFRAGGASGTVAKTMSAYDKDFSDAIYGKEIDGRYVTEQRLRKMLEHEYGLIEQRLSRDKFPNKCYFAFANTIATINFTKKFKGHGWMGLRFQLDPDDEPNDVIFHIRMKEEEAYLQQETIGIMGVNLIYGCFHIRNNPEELLRSLYDNIAKYKIEIDMIHFEGPEFKNVDNRLMSLQLIKNGMTDAVIFGPEGNNILPAALLYKKNILALRGSFRPATKVNIDMIKKGFGYFVDERKVDRENLVVLFEITLNNLKAEGEIDEQDFLDRAEILCSLGQTVLISNYQQYYKLVEYFTRYTEERMGLIMGVTNLEDLFDEHYYRDLKGGILEAFGILYSTDLKIYVYPSQPTENEEIETSKTVKIHPRLRPLYEYLMFNRRVIDIENYDPEILQIFSRDVLQKIRSGEEGWEKALPAYVDNIIRDKKLFGYDPDNKNKRKQEEENDNRKKEKQEAN